MLSPSNSLRAKPSPELSLVFAKQSRSQAAVSGSKLLHPLQFATNQGSSIQRDRRPANPSASPPSSYEADETHPFTHAPALELKKMQAPATSCGVPILPSGTPAMIISRPASRVAAITAFRSLVPAALSSGLRRTL